MSLQKFLTKCKLKTNYFTKRECNASGFKADQCIIINEKDLPHVNNFNYEKPTEDKAAPLDWFPLVNSYYNFAEDVCAYERVSKLLTTRPSATSLKSENDILYETDPYSEKDAQLQYLTSKPVCFVILGKPGAGQEELGKKLAEYWKCVYIEPETLIKEEIDSGTRAGECIEFNLRCGRAIGIDIILRLIEKRIKSRSAQHRGFVIAGLPVVPNELYEEDPISSESAVFNVHEIFEEIYDTVIEIGVPVIKHVSIVSESKIGESEEAAEEKLSDAEQVAEEESPIIEPAYTEPEKEKVMIDVGSAHENICQQPLIGANSEEQLQYILGLIENPLILIYIRCGNEDLIAKRDSYRYHLYTQNHLDFQQIEIYTTLHSLYSTTPGATDYEVPSDFFDIIPHDDTTKLQHLVRFPQNFPANVASQLNSYYLHALTTIEQYILRHDPQYFLKVDGRATSEKMFSVVKTRLEILPIQKVVLPERLNLIEPPKEGEEFQDVVNVETLSFEECFKKIRRRQIPNNMFKWNWSEWGKKCPVSMKEGSYKDGDVNFAVHFMNKMFFLADEAALWKFYCNPRPYLLPPYPKPSCRIFIFGPPASGKTTIAKCLGYLLNSTVLCIEEMKESYHLQKEKEFKEMVKQTALIEAINILNSQRERCRMYRDELLSTWYKFIQSEFQISRRESAIWKKEAEVVKFELPLDIDSPHKVGIEKQHENEPIPILEIESDDDWAYYLKDSKNFDKFLPSHLGRESGIDKPATVLDEFVRSYAQNAADNAIYVNPDFSDEDAAEMFISHIKEVEDRYFEQGNNRGGWIVDGMPVNFNLLEMISPDYLADDVFILRDQSKFLLKSYSFDGRVVFRNFRQFFFDIGNVDAAWRSPDTDSTPSIKRGMIRDILYDVLLNKYVFEDGTQPGEIDETILAPTWTKSVQSYADNLRTYDECLDQLMEFFNSKQLIPVDINVSEKTIIDLLKDVVKSIQDRYGLIAIRMSDEERYREFEDFGSANVQAEGMFEGAAEPVTQDLFSKNRRYGDTFHYCPVSLYDKWVLWKGKEECAVMYDNKVYLLATDSDVTAFLNDPKKYTFGNKPPLKVPPQRVCILGTKGVGKTTVAKALSQNIGVTYVYQPVFSEDDLEQFIDKIWFNEPMKSVGFVIDDFPKNLTDMTFMIEHKAIPDLLIHIVVSEFELKTRMLKKALLDWREATQAEKIRRELAYKETYSNWERQRALRLQELLEEKRQDRYSRQMKQKRSEEHTVHYEENRDDLDSPPSVAASSQVTYDSFAEEEDKKEIEELLDAEMPEPVFQEVDEDEEEALFKFEDEIDQLIQNETNAIEEIRGVCQRELISWIDLDGNLNEDSTIYQAYIQTMDLKNRNKSMFERCYDVSLNIAEELLSSGYYFLSKFGKTCPIQYVKDSNPIQMYLPMKEKNHLYPVIYRQFIYFLAGEENWLEFKSNPLKYVNVTNFNFPLIPFRIAIIGPPKSSKSRVAERLQSEYSFKMTTCGQAIRYVLRYLPYSKLAKEIESNLKKGDLTTSKMQMESAEVAYFDPHGVTQGILFDGFPNNQQEAAALRDLGIMPHLILYLQADDDRVYSNFSTVDSTRHLPTYSLNFFNLRYNYWKENAPIFTKWMDREYQNIARISTDFSLWRVFNDIQKIIIGVFSEIKHYYIHAHDDWPLRVANTLITPLEYLERVSEFRSYCPCCLYYSKTLRSGGELIPDRTNLVHFTQYFYWICSEHIEQFLKFPEIYLPPFNMNFLPRELPWKTNLTAWPQNCYEGGVCMVCYSSNKLKKVFTMGLIEFAVTYNDKIYLFDTEECMNQFLARPFEFASLVIAYKDPNMATLKYNELPILGYLEQYVAKDIVKAVSDVARERPVVPGLSIHVSAAIHIALFLKIFCSDTKHVEMYKRADALYRERREKLIVYLEKMKTYLNPKIYYQEPMPRFKGYLPNRNLSDYMRRIIYDMLDKVDYNKVFTGI